MTQPGKRRAEIAAMGGGTAALAIAALVAAVLHPVPSIPQRASVPDTPVPVTAPAPATAREPAAAPAAQPPKATRRAPRMSLVSRSPSGKAGDGDSFAGTRSVSSNGRYVVFWSAAAGLVEPDGNGAFDVFRHDRRTRRTSIVSASSTGGRTGNGDSFSASISADGSVVAFVSRASDLVLGDDNERGDYFVRDLAAGRTQMIALPAGAQFPLNYDPSIVVSGNGRYVVFRADRAREETRSEVYRFDRRTGATVPIVPETDVAVPVHAEGGFAISHDGRYVAFVAGDDAGLVPRDTNGHPDVFVKDFRTGQITRASLRSDGSQLNGSSHAPSLSSDGNRVAFATTARNVGAARREGPALAVRDRTRGKLLVASAPNERIHLYGGISAGGRFIAYEASSEPTYGFGVMNRGRLFLADLDAGTHRSLARLTAFYDGGLGWNQAPALSGDSKVLVFSSSRRNTTRADSNRHHDVFAVEL